MERLAALGVSAVLTGVAALQVALALGIPWGHHAYGGRVVGPGQPLPSPYRLASAVAVLVLLAAAWVVLARAGILADGPLTPSALQGAAWAVAGVLALNTLANLASTSAVERWGLGSATAIAAVLAVVVARS